MTLGKFILSALSFPTWDMEGITRTPRVRVVWWQDNEIKQDDYPEQHLVRGNCLLCVRGHPYQ